MYFDQNIGGRKGSKMKSDGKIATTGRPVLPPLLSKAGGTLLVSWNAMPYNMKKLHVERLPVQVKIPFHNNFMTQLDLVFILS